MSQRYIYRILQQKTLVILLLFLLISLLCLGAAYYYSSENDPLATFYLSVGSSLLAATVFSIAHSYYTHKESTELINSNFKPILELLDNINKESSSHLRISSKSLINTQNLESKAINLNKDVNKVISYIGNIPKETYMPSNEFRTSFNDNFVESLSNSDFYFFKGTTGRYAVSRIIERDIQLASLKLILPNPKKASSFASRQQHNKVLDDQHKRLDRIDDKIEKEMLIALCGLFAFAAPKIKQISIGFTDEPFIDRIELTENDVFIEMFDNSVLGKYNFPKIYQLSKNSLLYEYNYRMTNEFLLHDVKSNHNFLSASLNGDFPEELKKYFKGEPLNDDKYNEYKQQFKEFHNTSYASICDDLNIKI